METASGGETVPLPKGMNGTAIFTTNSSSLVIKGAADAYYRSAYSWEPGKAPKLVVRGRDLDISRLSDDTFAAYYSENNRDEIVTLNAQKLMGPPLQLPKGGPPGWGGCEGDTHYVVCIGNRPGMTVEDKDFDEMAFTAVLVINLSKRKTIWFPVGHRTHFRFDTAHGKIYVINWIYRGSHGPVTAFDLAGRNLGTARLRDVMPRSPSGRYAESLQEDGAVSWEVYDAARMKLLLAFNCDQPGCREGDNDEPQWNPKFAGQMVALREGGAYGKGGACDIYQASTARLVKTLPCEGLPVYDWTRDGRQLVTLSYEGNIFRRQPVN